MVTIHFQPLADQIYVYADGSYAERSPHTVTMDVTYSHQGTRCFVSNIKGEFNKDVWVKLREAFIERGLLLVEYEHKGKDGSVDLTKPCVCP